MDAMGDKTRIRVVIADDHPIFRDGLRKLLSLEDDFDVVGEARDGNEVLEIVRQGEPDVLLLDLRMPGMDGLTVLQNLKTSGCRTKIIILTASEDKNEFVQAMKLGCSGIVLKQTATELLYKSIRKVNSGEIWLDSHTTAAVMRQFASPGRITTTDRKGRERSPLSQREREIVALVASPRPAEAVLRELRDLLPSPSWPRRLRTVEAIPITPSGKRDRALILPLLEGPAVDGTGG